jgi:hypothetical protein
MIEAKYDNFTGGSRSNNPLVPINNSPLVPVDD